jgi:hypothetical protein
MLVLLVLLVLPLLRLLLLLLCWQRLTSSVCWLGTTS